jgi:hypothetical protein
MIIAWRWICIFRDPRTRRCLRWIRIPIIVWFERFFELPPRPDPPWLRGVEIRPELAHDLQVLATIDALAQTLSEGPQKAMLESVQKQFDALDLPEDMKILSDRDLDSEAKSP